MKCLRRLQRWWRRCLRRALWLFWFQHRNVIQVMTRRKRWILVMARVFDGV